MEEALRRFVLLRSGNRCEYCSLPAAYDPLVFCVDHIIAQQHQGLTVAANLAGSCFSCNSCKGPNIAGIDPETQELTRLFHPRSDIWNEHFFWDGDVMRAKTAVGRVALYVLDINDPVRIEHRRSLIEEGVFSVN